MIVKMDEARRLHLPKSLREQFDLRPGCQLLVETDADRISLRPTLEPDREAVADRTGLRQTAREPEIIDKQGIPVHHGPTQSTLDVTEFIRAQRDARHARIAGHG